jgi:hypothetical protein
MEAKRVIGTVSSDAKAKLAGHMGCHHGSITAVQSCSNGFGENTASTFVNAKSLGRRALVSPFQAPSLHLENLQLLGVH